MRKEAEKRNRDEDTVEVGRGEDLGQLVAMRARESENRGQGSECRESYGHGAEVGEAGWGRQWPQLLAEQGPYLWTGHARSFLPSPHAWACCHIP